MKAELRKQEEGLLKARKDLEKEIATVKATAESTTLRPNKLKNEYDKMKEEYDRVMV